MFWRRYLKLIILHFWSSAWWGALLTPLSWIYAAVYWIRSQYYHPQKLARPSIVIGNLTAGGTGKTPCIVALGQALLDRGYKLAVVSKGYLALEPVKDVTCFQSGYYPALHMGDEPALIGEALQCPVIVGPNRLASAHYASSLKGIDLILFDDGLQDGRLDYAFKIMLYPGGATLGNHHLLPAGPRRSFWSLCDEVDMVFNLTPGCPNPYLSRKFAEVVVHPLTQEKKHLSSFASLTLITGIAFPLKLYEDLRKHAYTELIACGDHELCSWQELQSALLKGAVVITQKDWVKIKASYCVVPTDNLWVAQEEVCFHPKALHAILTKLDLKKGLL